VSLVSIGAGAHGTVYAAGLGKGALLAKVSHANTAAIVEAECQVMQQLEAAGVPFASRCAGVCALEDRVVAVFSPFFPGARQITATLVASLPPEAQEMLIRSSASFLVRSLAAGIVVSDLQALVRTDGSVLFIDFSEAMPFASPTGASAALQALGEWCTVLPPATHGAMADALTAELRAFKAASLCQDVAEVLADAPLFAAPEAALSQLQAAARWAAR